MPTENNQGSDENPLQINPFALAQWRVNPSRNLLSGPDGDVQVTHKSMEVLCLLAEANGDVLTRRELLHKIWPGTVVNEESLTRVISDLRRALGDDRSRLRYIETIPKRGYRLIAEVVRETPVSKEPEPEESTKSDIEGQAESPESKPVDIPEEAAPAIKQNSSHRWFVLVSLLVVLVVFLAIRLLKDPVEQVLPVTLEYAEIDALTSTPGTDTGPAFSADGTRVAFSRRISDVDPYHIFVKQPGQANELQLTNSESMDLFPAWSPDGATIAFVRSDGLNRNICTMPSMGGPVRVVYRLEGRVRGLDWSPDGSSLAMGFCPYGGVFSIQILNLGSGVLHQLLMPVPGSRGDLRPRYSPSGTEIAYIRNNSSGMSVICICPVEGCPAVVLPYEFRRFYDLDWYSDGQHIVASGDDGSQFSIWRLAVNSQELTPVALPVEQVAGLSLCQVSGDLAIHVPIVEADLVRFSLNNREGQAKTLPGEVMFRSTLAEYLPAVEPSSSRVAFCSTRTGEPQIYLAEAGSVEAVALTSFTRVHVISLEWSPNGSQLLFSAWKPDSGPFFALLDPNTGQQQNLPLNFNHFGDPVWSADGQWIYFNSHSDGVSQVHKIRPSGTDLSLVHDNRYLEIVSPVQPDETIYFIDQQNAGLFRLDADGTVELVVMTPPYSGILANGSLGDRLFYTSREGKQYLLISYNLSTGISDTLGTFPLRTVGRMALYPDGNSLLVSTSSMSSSNLMLVPDLP